MILPQNYKKNGKVNNTTAPAEICEKKLKCPRLEILTRWILYGHETDTAPPRQRATFFFFWFFLC